MNFLCSQHKIWLLESRERAELYWTNWTESAEIDGNESVQHTQISHAGCAWELAGAMLHKDVFCSYQALERFTRSGALLMRLLSAAELPTLANRVGDVCDRALCLLIADKRKKEAAQYHLQLLQLERSRCLPPSATH